MMRCIYIGLATLILAGVNVLAQTGAPAPSGANSPDTLYKFEGAVINAETGRPIPRALVELYDQRKSAVLTGSEGDFSLGKLHKGWFMIRATKPGYYESAAGSQGYPLRRIVIGPDTGKVILKLEPEAVISGVVVNEDGEPIEGAAVEALYMGIVDGRRQLVPVYNTVRTDEDGVFRLGELRAGKYILSVKPGGALRRMFGAQAGPSNTNQAYPAITYFPSGTDMGSATPIELAAGQQAEAQFSLSLRPAFKFSGTVSGLAGFKKVGPLTIVDSNERPVFTTSRWDGQTGAFEFPPMPAGAYMLRIYATTEDDRPVWLHQEITLHRDVTGFNVALQPGAAIPVVVRAELASTPSSQCSGIFSTGAKTFDCSRMSAIVELSATEPRRAHFSAEPDANDPASMTIRGVAPGRYRVGIHPLTAGYVASVRSGGANLLQEELLVPAGGKVPSIEVVLRDDGAKLKVHVHSERPLEHARILLLPESAPYQIPPILDTDATGEREYGNLAPGDYMVLAFESMDNVEYGNPEFLSRYSAKTTHVTLAPRGNANVNVELILAGDE